MQTLVFATGNPHKAAEVSEILQGLYTIKSLSDIGCTEDIPETEPTFTGNALLKARYVLDHYQLDCFAEDTGLEVDTLGGDPGVLSARYAGANKSPEANMQLLLRKLQGQHNRGAQFRTVIALLMHGEEHLFEGIIRGHITESPAGESGFGYDPIFIPDGYDRTFAQMSSAEKHAISHRGKAVQKLLHYLRTKAEIK